MTNNINIPSKSPNESPAPTISPEVKLATLERQVTLADPNKPKPPLEAKPGDPFPPDVVPTKPPASGETPTGKTPPEGKIAEVKEGFMARMRDMGSQFGAKISGVLDTSGDAIKKGFASVTGIFGVGKTIEWLKGKSESISSWLSKEGMFQNILGGKDGWASNILSKILGFLGIKAAVTEKVEKVKETIKDAGVGYTATVKIIANFFIDKEKVKGADLYSMDSFRSKSYAEIESIYKNRGTVPLREAFKFPESSSVKEKELEAALACIVDPQSKKGAIFRKQLGRSLPVDYEKLPMTEVLTKMANPLSYMKALSSIDMINNPTEMFDSFGFDVADDGTVTGELASKTDTLSPSAKKTLLASSLSRQRFSNKKQSLDALQVTTEGKNLTPDELKEYAKIFQFGEDFRAKVLGNPQIHLGMKDAFKQAFDEKGLTMFGITSLYCMLDGKTDFENMTGIEKLAFYGGCATIASSLDTVSKGKFTATYIKEIGSTGTNIPQDVKDIGTEFLGGAVQKVGSGIWKSLEFLGGAVMGAPEYALGALALYLVGGKVRRAIHKWGYH